MSYPISLLNFKLVVYGDKKKKMNLRGVQVTFVPFKMLDYFDCFVVLPIFGQ